MKLKLTPRQQVERALYGQDVDKIPFTVYANKLPRSLVERELRNMGLCVIEKSLDVLRVKRPDVKVLATQYVENGISYIRTDYDTPIGSLSEIWQEAGFTRWCTKRLFAGPDDYKKLFFIVDNERYEPDYKPFLNAQRQTGGDVFFRAAVGPEPLQAVIGWMGIERFGLEWMEHRDEVLKVYEALVSAARRRYSLLADSPALAFNYGGNVVAELISPRVFEQYYLPNYDEAAEKLHKTGKLIGSHFDGNCKAFAGLIHQSQLDYIEAFTPAPDTDMTLSEAILAWPDKCLWINFPSSVHLAPTEEIRNITRQILDTAAGHSRFLIGITENVPPDRWQQNFRTIAKTIDEYYRR
ncbi:MAG: uroporphyrinogen decarboxylase family protein [Planctomycetota bacterium]